jgi:hypothetical protein
VVRCMASAVGREPALDFEHLIIVGTALVAVFAGEARSGVRRPVPPPPPHRTMGDERGSRLLRSRILTSCTVCTTLET